MFGNLSEEERKRRGKGCATTIYIIGGIIAILIVLFFAMSLAGGSSKKQVPTAVSAPLGSVLPTEEAPEAQPEPTVEARLLIRYEVDGQCLIKGNINGRGAKIYHVPGSTAYEATKIDEGTGERWFCTEQEAIEAGWHAPGK